MLLNLRPANLQIYLHKLSEDTLFILKKILAGSVMEEKKYY